ncbi:MAG: arginine--tRNA ligase [Hyphomicrobiales bacterium]|nr:MAG: arginine--tRNA ligase [Hyphomicrobiales bacterium]
MVRTRLEELAGAGVLPADSDFSKIAVEPPRDAAHGDIATNAAMVLARPAGLKPRDLAEQIAKLLREEDEIEGVEVAGPGFINIRLAPLFWPQVLHGVLEAGRDFGRCRLGTAQKVNVEYVSANPTGPMHVGHCRGAVFGDALANLLDFAGFEVTREYYINDAGAQVDVLARSAYLRYREALGEEIGAIPEGLYPGDYLKPVGAALAAEFGDSLTGHPEEAWLETVRERAIAAMMEMIRDDLAALNVRHDVFFSERSLVRGEGDRIGALIAELGRDGLVYEGRLDPPKGKLPEDWEDREQTLFRAREFGDDSDRPLLKSDGSYTYFAADIAYHADKFRRGFADMIDVWGADHGGYVKRMQAAVKAVSGGEGALDVKLVQLVKLYRGGEPVKMSKRSGTFVTLRDVVDEVGRDPVRFMMLYRKNDAPLDFDFQKVTEQSRDNPVFYVQYAHARISSVLRNAAEELGAEAVSAANLRAAPLERLDDAAELTLIRRMAEWPRLVEQAALAHEPHRVAFYLYELSSDFHGLWNRGKDSPQLRFIRKDDTSLTFARLALIQCTASILAAGLDILGVEAVEEM